MKFVNATLGYDEKPVLEKVNIEIQPGSFTFMVGNSGSGKTTFMNAIAGVHMPESGEFQDVNGNNIYRYTPKSALRYKQGIATIYQDYKLIDHLTAHENIAYALEVRGVDAGKHEDIISEVFEKVHLEGKEYRFPRQLSGGEQQRLAIARALALNPEVILADESTGNLDPRTSREILGLFLDLNANGTTVIFATHDFEMVKSYGKTIYRLEDGRLSEYERVTSGE